MPSINMGMSNWTRLVRVIPPETTVVSVDEVKAHLSIDHDDDDDYLTTLIRAAEAYVEGPNGIGVVMLEQTWRLSLDRFSGPISIPMGPVKAISEVTYKPAMLVGQPDSTTYTLDPASYVFDLDSQPLKIVPAYGHSWPSVTHSPVGAVKVVFTAGWGDPSEVPGDLRAAVLLLIGHLHRNREAASDRPLTDIPFGVQTVFDRYRIIGVA